jgi:hypothetical protein
MPSLALQIRLRLEDKLQCSNSSPSTRWCISELWIRERRTKIQTKGLFKKIPPTDPKVVHARNTGLTENAEKRGSTCIHTHLGSDLPSPLHQIATRAPPEPESQQHARGAGNRHLRATQTCRPCLLELTWSLTCDPSKFPPRRPPSFGKTLTTPTQRAMGTHLLDPTSRLPCLLGCVSRRASPKDATSPPTRIQRLTNKGQMIWHPSSARLVNRDYSTYGLHLRYDSDLKPNRQPWCGIARREIVYVESN